MSNLRRIVALMLGVVGAGCALSPEQAAQHSSYELCYKVAIGAFNREVRINELNRRGENCSRYQDTIRQQVAAEEARKEREYEAARQHQRQLELERVRASQQPTVIYAPSYKCRSNGFGGMICDPD